MGDNGRTDHFADHLLYCDNGGIIRGKATHAGRLASRMHNGIGQSLAMQAFTGVESLATVDGMGPVAEFRLVPDPNTFVVLPYVPNAGSMLCALLLLDGQPWEACPRSFLKQMVARLAEHGMRAEAAVEHEFYLTRQENGAYVPADNSLCYSSIGLDEQAGVVDSILGALEKQHVALELFHTELDPGQQELSVRHADVLRARRRIRRLPTTLDEALDELEQDRVLTEALGPLLTTSYLAVKRSESAFFQNKTPEEETRQHFYKY